MSRGQTTESGKYPDHIADLQTAWSRRHSMRRAYESGVTIIEIAKHIGLSKGRVSQLVIKATRECLMGRMSPVEFYLSKPFWSNAFGYNEPRAWRKFHSDMAKNPSLMSVGTRPLTRKEDTHA